MCQDLRDSAHCWEATYIYEKRDKFQYEFVDQMCILQCMAFPHDPSAYRLYPRNVSNEIDIKSLVCLIDQFILLSLRWNISCTKDWLFNKCSLYIRRGLYETIEICEIMYSSLRWYAGECIGPDLHILLYVWARVCVRYVCTTFILDKHGSWSFANFHLQINMLNAGTHSDPAGRPDDFNFSTADQWIIS